MSTSFCACGAHGFMWLISDAYRVVIGLISGDHGVMGFLSGDYWVLGFINDAYEIAGLISADYGFIWVN